MNPINVSVRQDLDGGVSFVVEDNGVMYEGPDALAHLHSVPDPKLRFSLEQRVSSLSQEQLFPTIPQGESFEGPPCEVFPTHLLLPLKAILKFCQRGGNATSIATGRAVVGTIGKMTDVCKISQKHIPSHPTYSEVGVGGLKTGAECWAKWQISKKLEQLMAQSLCSMAGLSPGTSVYIGVISLVGSSVALSYEWDNFIDLLGNTSSLCLDALGQIPTILEREAEREGQFALQCREAVEGFFRIASTGCLDALGQIPTVLEREAEREEQFALQWREAIEGLLHKTSTDRKKEGYVPFEYDLTMTGRELLGKRPLESSTKIDLQVSEGEEGTQKSTQLGKEATGQTAVQKDPLPEEPPQGEEDPSPQKIHLNFSLNLAFEKKDFVLTPPPPPLPSYWEDRINVRVGPGRVYVGVDFSKNPGGSLEGSIHDPAHWRQENAEYVKAYFAYQDYKTTEVEALKIDHKVMPNPKLGDGHHRVKFDATPLTKENPFDPKHPFQITFAEFKYGFAYKMDREVIGVSDELLPFVEFHRVFFGKGKNAACAQHVCKTKEMKYFEEICDEYIEYKKQESLAFIAGKNFRPAKKNLAIYHQLHPDDLDTCKALMYLCSETGNDTEALTYAYQIPSEKRGADIELWMARMNAQLGHQTESLELYRHYEGVAPEDKTALLEHAILSLQGQEKDKEEARRILAGLETPSSWQLLALDSAQRNSWKEAVEFAEKDPSLKNFSTELRQAASLFFEQQKDFSQSFSMLEPLVDRAEGAEKSTYNYALADLACKQNEFSKAAFYVSEGLKTDSSPDKNVRVSLLGHLQLQTRNVDKALESFQTYLKNAPDDLVIQSLCARLYKDKGDVAKARTTLLGVLEKKPNHVESLILLSNLYIEQKNAFLAVETLERTLAVDPKQNWAHLVLGNLYMQERSFSKALDHLEKFLKVNPKEERALYLAGMAYMETNQLDKAREKFLLMVKHNPNSAVGEHALQVVQQQMTVRIAQRRLVEEHRVLQMGSDSCDEPNSDFPLVAATAPAYWFTRRLKRRRGHSGCESLESAHSPEGLPTVRLSEESLSFENPEAVRLAQEDQIRYPKY